jgi:hypothetical protein
MRVRSLVPLNLSSWGDSGQEEFAKVHCMIPKDQEPSISGVSKGLDVVFKEKLSGRFGRL